MVEKSDKKAEKDVAKSEHSEKKKKPEAKKEEPVSETMKGIVRIAGRDVRGHVKLRKALTYIRGISHSMSVPVSRLLDEQLHIPPTTKIGELSDAQIESIDKILFALGDYDVPKYLFNRRGDAESGADKHVIMNDLSFSLKQDIERLKKAYTWKGYRHSYSQKVRGQRTRNTGRTGMAVGVLKKTLVAASGAGAQAPAAAGAGAAAPAGGKAAAAPAGGGKAAAPAAAKAPAAKPAAEKK
jgi:small subunit ribosomal protein S13